MSRWIVTKTIKVEIPDGTPEDDAQDVAIQTAADSPEAHDWSFNVGAGGVTSVVYIDQPERDAQMDDANRREDERERQDGIGGD